MARNSLFVINSSIYEKVKLREDIDVSEEGKKQHSLKSIRRRHTMPINVTNNEIFHRGLKIDKLNKNRKLFGNDAYNIKRHKYK